MYLVFKFTKTKENYIIIIILYMQHFNSVHGVRNRPRGPLAALVWLASYASQVSQINLMKVSFVSHNLLVKLVLLT